MAILEFRYKNEKQRQLFSKMIPCVKSEADEPASYDLKNSPGVLKEI